MIDSPGKCCIDARVAIAGLASAAYPRECDASDEISAALWRAAQYLGWSDDVRGPFANVIAPDARVVIKPNFVTHANQGPWGIEPLITHASLVRAAVAASLRAGASRVLVGDAPIQGCDFPKLLAETGLDTWAAELMECEPRFQGIRDFRRTTCDFVNGVRVASEDRVPADQFVLYDLGSDSLLEPVSNHRAGFRVTCYDPRLMARTHAPGRHRYLVAREIIEADAIVNLPKLKTHKKAGITCALKNLIGINGNKEYLPHHRVGGAGNGGDCYPGRSVVKRALEYTLDLQNTSSSYAAGRVLSELSGGLTRVSSVMGDRLGVEGSWSGNDTVWRTGLDLNRVLLYGKPDATLADTRQRQVIHVVDAVIAGQGEGPLSPQPLEMGLLLAGNNAAAIDLVGAQLLGYDPARVPIVREAFGDFRWPIASFDASDVEVTGTLEAEGGFATFASSLSVIHPEGWRDAARAAGVSSQELQEERVANDNGQPTKDRTCAE